MPKKTKSDPRLDTKTPFSNYEYYEDYKDYNDSSSLLESDNCGYCENEHRNTDLNIDLNNDDVSTISTNTPSFVQITDSNWNSDVF